MTVALSPDNDEELGGWKQQFAIAANGAFPALTKLREEGVIAAWGLGVNRIEPIREVLRVADIVPPQPPWIIRIEGER